MNLREVATHPFHMLQAHLAHIRVLLQSQAFQAQLDENLGGCHAGQLQRCLNTGRYLASIRCSRCHMLR